MKILVVDDERVLVKGIKFNLESEGYQVEVGYDGEQAVELAGQLAQQGFGAIEVCGAFGKELAERMFHATGERVSVGYVVCPQEQKELSDRFWSQP